MTANLPELPLGKKVAYRDCYDPGLLYPVLRSLQRDSLGATSFHGYDLWCGYEVSWLGEQGKPEARCLKLWVPCHSPYLIESKSMKLYLNSLNQTVFPSEAAVHDCLVRDLSGCAGHTVRIQLEPVIGHGLYERMPGRCLDDLSVACHDYQVNPALLQAKPGSGTAWVHSHLFKSNCLVTGQPDWASIVVGYEGCAIDEASLLRYWVSYRQHQAFHEHCVERIFVDLWQHCRPEKLCVTACFTRRGGLDISPMRTSHGDWCWEPKRLWRQ